MKYTKDLFTPSPCMHPNGISKWRGGSGGSLGWLSGGSAPAPAAHGGGEEEAEESQSGSAAAAVARGPGGVAVRVGGPHCAR